MERSRAELGQVTGWVTDIQRFSLYDGPGIRTTVFLKGCPLRCQWCHNPETLAPHSQLRYRQVDCTRCGACAAACPRGVHRVEDTMHALRWEECAACGTCVAACPAGALSICGSRVSAGEVLAETLRDRRYYGDDGGLTVSGGEPLFQPEFTHALLVLARLEGLHTCMETSGVASWLSLQRTVEACGLYLFDWKAATAEQYRRWTGGSQRQALDNLRNLSEAGANIVLRCPIVSGVNDAHEDLAALAEAAEHTLGVRSVELMAYHRLGAGKYAELGLRYALPELPDYPLDRRDAVVECVRTHTGKPVRWG